MSKNTILIAGAGGIGQATGLILSCRENTPYNILIGDLYPETADNAAQYINRGSAKDITQGFHFSKNDEDGELVKALEQADIILDCLPGSQAPRLARMAQKYNCHYANLTEYVKETDEVTEIANNSNTGFILQTGLAPGYINVIANHLFQKFTSAYGVDTVDSLDMKVGALSKHARHPYFYAYTWSPIGVATEYVKKALVVEDFKTSEIASLSRTEKLLIDGVEYEDDFTSGGAADLPIALAGRVKNLNYKTIRYPGHYEWARNIIKSTPEGKDKVEHLNNTMLDSIPAVEDDVVIVFASVKGKDSKGVLRAMERSTHVYPSKVGKETLRAIQTTTAAPLCESAMLLLSGKYKGPVFQSQLDTDSFLNGSFVSQVYGRVD